MEKINERVKSKIVLVPTAIVFESPLHGLGPRDSVRYLDLVVLPNLFLLAYATLHVVHDYRLVEGLAIRLYPLGLAKEVDVVVHVAYLFLRLEELQILIQRELWIERLVEAVVQSHCQVVYVRAVF